MSAPSIQPDPTDPHASDCDRARLPAKPPLGLFILGSCVSRDAMALVDEAADISLVSYVARTSFASQACRPWKAPQLLEAITSPFQRRMVQTDIGKTLLGQLKAARFDVLLVDLIDDRFHLLEHRPGCFATASSEFVRAVGQTPRGRLVSHSSKEFDRLWTAGLNQLLDMLRETNQLHKLRINEVYWAQRDTHGNALANMDPNTIAAANDRLRQRYAQLAGLLPDTAFYRYPTSVFVADPDHRWGLSPYHYARPLYHATLTHLRRDRPEPPKADATA